ncbi:dTDP-4-amino-4,6-dideoxygalactose transaminase [Lacihabitans sp. LS3-19]|uniref:dTDP-4-amino-4,6-dideoxygalactose transaminase n=1 Tax=Lacihabitans sp. LS3-19 TaxID=2487335 RepID=UPI0020CBEF20|nr:dTDP-4-amino-4,6-dideoxygalactose transaminase [Lacihabitans sp. LS3-19]MCP9767651.1 dTDP-4-amino-4,6-dideoxygalactose transaminase [Lacihabitans sp. LS3-19]
MEYLIPFNRPFLTGKENEFVNEVFRTRNLSGNGPFTKKSQAFFENRFGFGKCLLTTSCTDALEMAAILIDIKPGDEVIVPSYTFVSSANPFILRGAKIVFIDSKNNHPSLDENQIESLITKKTKAIVVVHYAGTACNMELVMSIAAKYKLYVIEDAAQAIANNYSFSDKSKKFLGSFGHLATFSFHETKNISSGEGGLLVINDKTLVERAEIIWEKGTNRNAFFKGIVDKYNWVDVGSSFLPSELIAALLYSQLQSLDEIQKKRIAIWNQYKNGLKEWALLNDVEISYIPEYSGNNAHIFYLIFNTSEKRDNLILKLKNKGILSVFHYLSLHKSPYYKDKHDGRELVNSDRYSDCLLRLPLFVDLTEKEVTHIINIIVN